MADSNKIDIPVNVNGAEESVRKLNALQRAAAATRAAFSALAKLHFAVAGVEHVTSLVKNLTSAADEARRKMADMSRAAELEKAAEGVKALAERYKELQKSIADAATEKKNLDEISDINRKNARDLEDARLDQSEAEELAAVGDGPDADREKADIKARYARERGNREAARQEQDVAYRRQSLSDSASAKRSAARQIEDSLADDDAQIRAARLRKARLEGEATTLNDEDDQTYFEKAASSIKKIFSLKWGRLGDDRTDEGDNVRERAKADAKAEDERIKTLEAERKRKADEAARLRAGADADDAKADALGGQLEVASVRRRTAAINDRGAQAAADRALADSEAARASALAAAPELAAQADSLKSRIAAEQSRKNAAGLGVFQAQNALDLARANGDPTGGATAALQSAQMAANEVNASADAAIAALTETLKSVEARLKAAQNFLEKQSSQSSYAWEDGNAAGA